MKGTKEKEHTEIDATVSKDNARSVAIGGVEASEAKECDIVGASFRPFGCPVTGGKASPTESRDYKAYGAPNEPK